MQKLINELKREIRIYSREPKKGESRWVVGYVDGLKKALKLLEEEYVSGEGD